jgi:drug/metabolite transporter (DMT)-like permease
MTWSASGHLLLLLAVVCEASYAVIGRVLASSAGARRIAALVNLWGLALSTPMGLMQALRFDFAVVTLQVWVLLVFYALSASVWSVWLWMTGLRHVDGSKAGGFTVMLPVSSTAIGVLLLGESPGTVQGTALLLAIASICLVSLDSHKPTAQKRDRAATRTRALKKNNISQ